MSEQLPFTRILQNLPPTVPFVPPEALEQISNDPEGYELRETLPLVRSERR